MLLRTGYVSPATVLATALERVTLIDAARARDALLQQLLAAAENNTVIVDFLNQHACNLIARDENFCENVLRCDWLLRDGIGAKLALIALGRAGGLNMNGTDFIPKLIDAFTARHATIASGADTAMIFFGTREPWLQAGARKLAGAYNGPIVVRDGFQADADYLAVLQPYVNHAKLIVLAMGMPRQEAVAQFLKDAQIGPALIVCGGAIIDFAAGRVARAPRWMQRVGLEWLYRLAREPRRMFARYVIGIPIFLIAVLRALRRQKKT